MTSMTSCIVGKKIRAMEPGSLELFPFVVLAIKFCIFLNNFYTGFQVFNEIYFTHTPLCTTRYMKTGASGPGLLELYPFFIFRYFDMHLFCVNFVSKISHEPLYLETWNFVHMASMTSCIVGKKIRAMGPGPIELFLVVVLAIKLCIYIVLNNFYTRFQILIKFILHIHLYALHVWYGNRGFRARFIRVISLCYISLFWYAFICVKDISRTTLPTNLKFCTHDEYD